MRIRAVIATLAASVLMLFGANVAQADSSYEVQRGDTLSGIASHYSLSWPTLWRLNLDIIDDPDLIYPGQVLKVEGKPRPATREVSATSGAVQRPATGAVTSPYGMRTHPISGVYKKHTGTDYSYGDGNAYAAKAGTAHVEYPGWAGVMVVIDHAGGARTHYAHLASVSISPGQHVDAGDVVGRIGSAGTATGPHLHFEVLVNGSYVNPEGWLN